MAILPAAWTNYPNVGALNTGTTNPSVSVSPPTGLASGDTWLIIGADWSGSGDSWAAPAGFTKLPASGSYDDSSANCGLVFLYKANCTGSETAVTVTDTQAQGLCAVASWRHSGGATTSPVDVSDGTGTAQYAAAAASYAVSTGAAHTPAAANEVAYFVGASGSGGQSTAGSPTWTTPSGWTFLGQADHDTTAAVGGASGDPAFAAVFYQVQTTATAIAITTSTATPHGNAKNAGAWVGLLVTMKAAAAVADPFPAYLQTVNPKTNPIYRM